MPTIANWHSLQNPEEDRGNILVLQSTRWLRAKCLIRCLTILLFLWLK